MIGCSRGLDNPVSCRISHSNLFYTTSPTVDSPFLKGGVRLISLRLIPRPFNDLSRTVSLVSGRISKAFGFGIPSKGCILFTLIGVHNFLRIVGNTPNTAKPILGRFGGLTIRGCLGGVSSGVRGHLNPLSNGVHSLFASDVRLRKSG